MERGGHPGLLSLQELLVTDSVTVGLGMGFVPAGTDPHGVMEGGRGPWGGFSPRGVTDGVPGPRGAGTVIPVLPAGAVWDGIQQRRLRSGHEQIKCHFISHPPQKNVEKKR